LAALGCKLQALDLFAPVRTLVQIPQKILHYSPTDKLYDAVIALLAGAHGFSEINSRLRADPALQAAFGRAACAEQSVVQDTLDATTPANVTQMEQALDQIYRAHSRGYVHDYLTYAQLLDVDMSGQPCGPKAAFATKGYFARQRNRRGRQVGRVVASHYGEIVLDRLFAGTTQLNLALPSLLLAAEATLELDAARRARTVVRVDAGGGSQGDVNWLLARDYRILIKEYSTVRAMRLAQSVGAWIADPQHPGREVGWVTEPAPEYCRPVQRLAVRCRKGNGQWGYGVLITNLTVAEVQELRDPAGGGEALVADALAYAYLYDGRGGGAETSFKDDRQGWGQRYKKRWEAAQMATYLTTLAHNIVIWARAWLVERAPRLAGYGLKRCLRDVWAVNGRVELSPTGHIQRIILNQAHWLTHHLLAALQAWLPPEQVVITSGET
jgi:hypothetical protein